MEIPLKTAESRRGSRAAGRGPRTTDHGQPTLLFPCFAAPTTATIHNITRAIYSPSNINFSKIFIISLLSIQAADKLKKNDITTIKRSHTNRQYQNIFLIAVLVIRNRDFLIKYYKYSKQILKKLYTYI